MIKAEKYNTKGEKKGELNLPKSIFDVKINSDLIYQVLRSQSLSRRQSTAHSKDRSEKRGGGRKPWRQKGTGRARHGSRRSPIWKGGGVTFGPRKERNFKKKINKKAKRLATFMVLSGKKKENLIFFVEGLDIKEPKTKEMREFLKNTFCDKSTLIVLPEMNKNLILATRNIEKVDTIQAKDINALDLLSYKYLIMPEEAVDIIKENFKPKEVQIEEEKPTKKTSTKSVKKDKE